MTEETTMSEIKNGDVIKSANGWLSVRMVHRDDDVMRYRFARSRSDHVTSVDVPCTRLVGTVHRSPSTGAIDVAEIRALKI